MGCKGHPILRRAAGAGFARERRRNLMGGQDLHPNFPSNWEVKRSGLRSSWCQPSPIWLPSRIRTPAGSLACLAVVYELADLEGDRRPIVITQHRHSSPNEPQHMLVEVHGALSTASIPGACFIRLLLPLSFSTAFLPLFPTTLSTSLLLCRKLFPPLVVRAHHVHHG